MSDRLLNDRLDWNLLRTFVDIVRAGGIGAAALACQWLAWRLKLPAILFLLLTGILALLWMVLALIPLLGWGNWFLIPFAAVGAIIAAVGILFTRTEHRGRAKAGLVLNGIVIVVGIIRLSLGGGIV